MAKSSISAAIPTLSLAAIVSVCACATQVNTLEDPPNGGGARGGAVGSSAGTVGKNEGGRSNGGSGGGSSGGSSGTSGGQGGGSTGGTSASGGTTGTGGSNASGGTLSSGGTNSSGGTATTGGAPATGGTTSRGGSSGAGGVASSGGSAGSGGSSAGGGGKGGSGGSSGTGNTPGCSDVTFPAVFDTYLSANEPTAAYGIIGHMLVMRSGASQSTRGLMRFDLSSIPSAANVESAVLTLTVVGNSAHDKTVAAHRVLDAHNWVEAEATWNKFAASGTWSTAGGDFNATPTATATVTKTDNAGTTKVTWNVKPDVTAFVATPAKNLGWIFKDTLEPAAGGGENVFFAVHEHGTPDWRPVLAVKYCK